MSRAPGPPSQVVDDYSAGGRLTLLTIVVVTLLVALLSRLYYLQVLVGDTFSSLAEANSIERVESEAPRGRIILSDGTELARNRVALSISIVRDYFFDRVTGELLDDPEVAGTVERLGQLLGVERGELLEDMRSLRRSPFRPTPVAVDVAPEIALVVQEHPELFPGVVAERVPIRQYPQGELAAHLVGYVNEISERQLESGDHPDKSPGDVIGQAGLEATYDDVLQGVEGVRTLVVNASRAVVEERSDVPPVRGNDVVLTLDPELQQAVQDILEEGIMTARSEFTYEVDEVGRVPVEATSGAAVVLDPATGDILASASFPTFDAQGLAAPISTEYFEYWQDPDNEYGRPALNRVFAEAFPPASTWKIASGFGALRADEITPDTQLGCPPSLEVGERVFRNWNRVDEGDMDLARALQRSCDTFFYEVAINQWVEERAQEQALDIEPGVCDYSDVDEEFQAAANEMGFGERIGLDLWGESPGRLTGRQWRCEYWLETKDDPGGACTLANEVLTRDDPNWALYDDLCRTGYVWRGGDAVNMSIGQGDLLTSPLQIAAAYGAVATEGTVMSPKLGQAILDPAGEVVETIDPVVFNDIDAPDQWWAELRRGLEDVVMTPRGTASAAFDGFPLDRYPVAGKTGTGQAGFNSDLERDNLPYSWFASYAPADDPEYVVVVMIERGGGGSQTAAPIVRRIYEEIFDIDATAIEAGPANVD
jgi:penicillin-binding protein 2